MKQIFKIAVIALAMVCSFSQAGDAKVRKTKTQTSVKSKGSWKVTSARDLEKRIVGSVWTCCPPDADMWFRLEFHSDHMLLKYTSKFTSNSPMVKGWPGGGKTKDMWRYEIVDDTDCVKVKFYKMERSDDFCYGSLIFYRNGKVYFDWLRGRQGGTATYGEHNWK